MKKFGTSFCGLLFAFVVSFPLQAKAISFSGTASGTWGNIIQTPSDSTFIDNDDLGGVAAFRWGDFAFCATCTPFRNRLTFDGIGSDGDPSWDADLDTPFLIGNFTYLNGSTYNSVGVSAVDLAIAVLLTSPVGVLGNYTFTFALTNTPNDTGDAVLDGDIVTISAPPAPQPLFSAAGIDYMFELLGFSSNGGTTVSSSFLSPEGDTARAGLYGRITATGTPIPEPMSLLLLGSALAASFLRRR